MDDKIIIELNFAQRRNIFKDSIADMCEKIGNSIDLDPNGPKIFTEIPMFQNKNVIIDTNISTFKGYILLNSTNLNTLS
ncbi:MAG: hypothetical protein ACREV6_02010 [Clostridium sp.]|uniref:hypothetical protein n=1 Tax=Clostridium sp. TaxID=1506 RepID=UPI003D6D7211